MQTLLLQQRPEDDVEEVEEKKAGDAKDKEDQRGYRMQVDEELHAAHVRVDPWPCPSLDLLDRPANRRLAPSPHDETDEEEQERGAGLDGRLDEGEDRVTVDRLHGVLCHAEHDGCHVEEIDEGFAADERPQPGGSLFQCNKRGCS